ncbi:hypothetical protein P389DRAFT_187329 [Cystobasidium minutum MCA 4210]|uniref:uncharacterized protein n=1 Tax=Cystobasidium minutum MCA 4210 TaxID=1397322 RepID=UPI0034CFD701|eukprot:jgi/Rhomi1/187329/estExt_fgenesh1_pg.C_1_t20129
MSLFGSFGSPANAAAGQQQAKPTFSFGTPQNNNNNNNAAPSTSSTPSFSFGNTSSTQQPAQTSAPSLFGGFGQQQQQSNTTGTTTPSLFGNNNNSSTQQPKPAFGGFGGFGQSNTAGASSTSAAPSTGFGGGSSLFGQSTSQQPQQQQQQQQQQPTNLFSSLSKPNPLTVSQLLSTSTNQPGSSFGSSQLGSQSLGASQAAAAPPQPTIEDRIMAVKNSWDPNSPQNRFSYFFYNLAPQPLTVPLTSLPVPANIAASPNQLQLYKAAVLEDPNPEMLVPVLATSFDDLQKRVNAQKNMASLHLGKLRSNEMMGKIKDGNKKHWSETVVRIERLNRTQTRLEGKLVHMCTRLAGLQSSPSGHAKDDSELLTYLERLQAELGGGSASNTRGAPTYGRNKALTHQSARLAGIVNELWMVVSQRKAMMQNMNNGRKSASPEGAAQGEGFSAEWGVVDEGELQRILEVLAQQQKSLDYMSKTLRSLLVDIDTTRLGFGMSPISGKVDEEQTSGRASIMA